ncbi:dihydrofolate reductase [Rhizobium sp. BK650]|uniref:dihydrofolate reductase family protein n=1 Tax=Rhizobium sp. BK650 TaxID=2586990 RepID=UPI001613BA8F|nr:dihydrofolate reductase family protein [Rhizobium sp. BK650]MBB3655586.1 dihydrofolate reductase [Rhizobium sp. BK650]
MRKIIASTFVSLDGVMQAPGGPHEDPVNGFKYGGWVFHYFDEAAGAVIAELFEKPFALLLGRKTYDIFAAYWPYQDDDIAKAFNPATKYVATHRPDSLSWQNSQALGADIVASLRKIKQEDGPDLLIQGSGNLIQTLLANELIDEMTVLTFPLLLGKGKRLFADGGAVPGALKLKRSLVSSKGVIVATYERNGEVPTGSFVTDQPSEAELERRRNWQ